MRSIALPPLAVAAGLFTELGTLVTDVGQRRILRLPSWATPRSMLLYRARLEQAASSMHDSPVISRFGGGPFRLRCRYEPWTMDAS